MPRCTSRSLLSAVVFSFILFPVTFALRYVTNEYRADFDDLPDAPGTDIGIYKYMHWHNFFVKQPEPNNFDEKHGGLFPKSLYGEGIHPQTPMACHDTLTTGLFGAARLSANYFGSQVALFDLQTFSFGCLVLDTVTHKATTIPKPCAVMVKGYSPGRSVDTYTGLQKLEGVKPSLEMTLWFTNPAGDEEEPTAETKMRMVRMLALDRTWWALGAVTFEAVADGPVMLCIDEVSFRTYNVTKWGETFAVPEHEEAL